LRKTIQLPGISMIDKHKSYHQKLSPVDEPVLASEDVAVQVESPPLPEPRAPQLADMRGTFRDHSGTIQGTFREYSGNIQRELSGRP
jgi:hypothetical protein